MSGDINRNFKFRYFGRNRHVCPNYKILDKPFETLKSLGGVERITIEDTGTDKPSETHFRGFSFIFKVFKFDGHSIEAYCTREERPEDNEHPAYITRVRLGNYDASDNLVIKISEALKNLPKSD
jgi:hypothetical protein